MERREALKLLAATAALPLLSRDAFSLFQAVHEQLPETAALKTLDPHQNATVIAVSEIIIPQTETPGAKAARVNEFIDVILTDWYEASEKATFLAGLKDLDSRSRDLFGKDFIESSATQQMQLLEALDDELPDLHEPPGASWSHQTLRPKQFFAMIKQLTLIGYYTSQIGFEQELHDEIIPARHAGCAPLEEEAAK